MRRTGSSGHCRRSARYRSHTTTIPLVRLSRAYRCGDCRGTIVSSGKLRRNSQLLEYSASTWPPNPPSTGYSETMVRTSGDYLRCRQRRGRSPPHASGWTKPGMGYGHLLVAWSGKGPLLLPVFRHGPVFTEDRGI